MRDASWLMLPHFIVGFDTDPETAKRKCDAVVKAYRVFVMKQ
jgi:hypothetical protein